MSNNKDILGNKGLINLGNTCYMNRTTMFKPSNYISSK